MSKRYRLLKDLPDVKAGVMFELGAATDAYYLTSSKTGTKYNAYVYPIDFVKNNFEWFEEVKEEWEIVNYIKNGFIHPSVRGNCVREGCKIHSVRRTSDGEVFSVGEMTNKGKINYFALAGERQTLIIDCGSEEYRGAWSIHDLYKVPAVPTQSKPSPKEEVPFTWTDEKVQQFCHNWWGQKDSFEEEVAKFKQSKCRSVS